MAYAIGASWLLCLVLLAAHLRQARRMRRIERQQLLDPSTLLGTPFALGMELEHMVALASAMSVVEVLVQPSDAIVAARTLRAACWHGVDQIFCLDLSRGKILFLSSGELDPAMQANYYCEELGSRRIKGKIGWAYTRSTDPETRKRCRDAATLALGKVEGDAGFAVELVEPDLWPKDNVGSVLTDLRRRRVDLCLTRADLAQLVRLNDSAIRMLEAGRACDSSTAALITAALSTIEGSVEKVRRLNSKPPEEQAPAPRSARPDLPAVGGCLALATALVARLEALQRPPEGEERCPGSNLVPDSPDAAGSLP